jgi:hypothetical protein
LVFEGLDVDIARFIGFVEDVQQLPALPLQGMNALIKFLEFGCSDLEGVLKQRTHVFVSTGAIFVKFVQFLEILLSGVLFFLIETAMTVSAGNSEVEAELVRAA